MTGLVGRLAAAPILFDAFARTGETPARLAAAPKGVIYATNARLPPPLQRFRPNGLPGDSATPQLRILYPPNGARIELGNVGGAPDPVALKIAGGVEPLTALVNGVPVLSPGGRRTLMFSPEGPGFMRVTVMDANGAADSVMVRLQ